jgi:hypothetical protein
MIGNACVGPMGRYLSVSLGKDWHIMILPTNNKRCSRFQDFRDGPVTSRDMEEFLPNWDSLEWQKTCVGNSRGVRSVDGKFQVRLLTTQDCTMSDEQIVGEFREMMRNGANRLPVP